MSAVRAVAKLSRTRGPGQLRFLVLDALWRQGEATPQRVQQDLGGPGRIALTTVATILQRLEKAGDVTHRLDGRQHVYRALVSREQLRASRLEGMLVEILRGDGAVDSLFLEESAVWLATQALDSAGDRAGLPPVGPRVSSRATRRHRDLAEHARQILMLRFGQSYSLDELARHVGVSVFHLCRVFSRQLGLTLHEYRTELRLRHALERLPEPGTDLTQVALEVGFSSHSHFTAAFRRAFGITPSAFARRARRCGIRQT